MLHLDKYRLKPFDHQIVGIEKLIQRVEPEIGRVIPGIFFIADEMRLGKTSMCINAAQELFLRGEIDNVVVVAPNTIKPVWYDPEIGEIANNTWVPSVATWVQKVNRSWYCGIDTKPLRWYITNYEFIRPLWDLGRRHRKGDEPRTIDEHLEELLNTCTERTVLILDESSAIKTHDSQQTLGCFQLRKRCGWVWELNGTPIDNSVADIYSQSNMLSPAILGVKNLWAFNNRYAIQQPMKFGGRRFNQIVGWKRVDEIQRNLAPYILRRLKADCLDLPLKLPPVTLYAPLCAKTWALYKEMQEEFIVWLSGTLSVTAAQAVVRSIRLSQMTGGLLGGTIEATVCCEDPDCAKCDGVGYLNVERGVQDISTEKLDVLMQCIDEQLLLDPNLKIIVWCRFRRELERVSKALTLKGITTATIWGNQPTEEREAALRMFHPLTSPKGPAVLTGITCAGAMGLDLSAASCVVHLSRFHSLKINLQSDDRPHGPRQVKNISYFDIVAEGPNGQQTIDHLLVKSLRNKFNIAEMTCSAWLTQVKRMDNNG